MSSPKPRPIPRRATHEPLRRGDVYYVIEAEQPPVGTELWPNRPAVIVSNQILANKTGFVQVVYLTSSSNKYSGPTHVELGKLLDPYHDSMALCEQVHTVDVSRLRNKLGIVPGHSMKEIDAALSMSLSIGHDPNTWGLFKKWENHINLHGADLKAEIEALSARTTDERVETLTNAVKMLSDELAATRTLYENCKNSNQLAETIREILSNKEEQNGNQ